MRGGVPLHIAVVYLDYAGKENGEEGNKQSCKSNNVLQGEVSHRWQTYSASGSTIVK